MKDPRPNKPAVLWRLVLALAAIGDCAYNIIALPCSRQQDWASIALETKTCKYVSNPKDNTRTVLPTNEQLADVLKLGFRKAFGEDISLLFLCVDVRSDNALRFSNLRSEEVVLER